MKSSLLNIHNAVHRHLSTNSHLLMCWYLTADRHLSNHHNLQIVSDPNGGSRTRVLRSFRWPGGKALHLRWLLPRLPECCHYIEPFGGSAVVLLNWPISPIETYNDLDAEVVNFLQMVREQPDELQRLIDLTPYSRAEFAASLGPSEHLSNVERARRFYVRVGQSHMGFSVNAPPSNWGTTPNESRNGMALASARFRSGTTWFNRSCITAKRSFI